MSIVRESSNNFLDMVAFLADPEKVKAEYQRIESARADAQKLVDLVGPAQEVIKLRDEAMRMNDEARTSLASAKSDASRTTSDAKSKAEAILAQARQKADEMTAQAANALNEAQNKDLAVANALASAKALEARAQSVIDAAIKEANYEKEVALSSIAASAKVKAKFEAAMKIVNSRVAALNVEVNA